ncbi:GGDEF domain-containing protein, partial [Pseudoalteromonas ruthenica]
MGSLAVIVLTKAANLRILHALTACISLAILALNLEWLQYFLGLSLLGHILFSLRHNDDSYLFLACFASVIFIVLLGGQILWSWPGVLTVSVVTILYLGQLLALNHIPETVP